MRAPPTILVDGDRVRPDRRHPDQFVDVQAPSVNWSYGVKQERVSKVLTTPMNH